MMCGLCLRLIINMTEVEWLDCPYMPDGWIAMKDKQGVHAIEVSTGYKISFPLLKYSLGISPEFKVDGDKVIGYLQFSLYGLRL